MFVAGSNLLRLEKVHIAYFRTEPHHDDQQQADNVDHFQTGELLYSGEERAPPLLVLLPPEVMKMVLTMMIIVTIIAQS